MINFNNLNKAIFFCLFALGIFKTKAQQAPITSGGNAVGTNGKITYSVGQNDYTYISNVFGSINQGVQQPFEIFTLGTDNFQNIKLLMTVYPNPTSDKVSLKIDDYNLEKLTFQLLDITGKKILTQKINTSETIIDLQNFATTTYILQILDSAKNIKTFKIIKNN